LNASVAVIDGTSEEALNITNTYNLLTSGFYSKLLESADKSGIIKRQNVQTVCPVVLTEGEDVCLPYIEIKGENGDAEVKGIALFSDDVMTGHLNLKESSMLLILTETAPQRTKLNLKVTDNKEKHDKNFVDFSIRKLKNKINVTANDTDIKATVTVNIRIEIDEFSSDHLQSQSKADRLE